MAPALTETDRFPRRLRDLARLAGIGNAGSHGVDQADVFVDFSQQCRPGIGGQFPAVEIRPNLLPSDAGELQW